MAVVAALDAFPGWAATPPHMRARVLFRFRDLVERDLDRLAAIITVEHGKVLADQGRAHPQAGRGGVRLRHSPIAQRRVLGAGRHSN